MPPERKKKGPSAATEAYPTGPVLLGELINALGLTIDWSPGVVGNDEADRDRSTYRALAGEIVEEPAVLKPCLALAAALVDRGVVPAGELRDPKTVVSFAIYQLVRQWDFVTQEHRVGPRKPLDWRVMTLAAAQLFAIDLAVRTGAWLSLLGVSVEIAENPVPSVAAAMEEALRSSDLSQGQLAEEIETAETTLYRWKKGATRPSDATLDRLARYLRMDTAVGTSVGKLRRQVAAAAILERLAEHLNAFDVEDVWAMFARTANQTVSFLATQPPKVVANHLRRDLVVFGAGSERASDLLRGLREQETEFRWQAPLDSMRDWGARLKYTQGIAWCAALPTSEVVGDDAKTLLVNIALAEATQAIDQVTSVWSGLHPELDSMFKSRAHLVHAAIAKRRHDHGEILAHVRAARALSSDTGVQDAVLTGLIEGSDLDAAIAQAATSDADRGEKDARMIWAAKEIAQGRVLDGREELERLVSEGGESGELLLYLGVARWRCEDFNGALDMLERVLKLPEFEHHAFACDIAAECAFRTGIEKRGLELARRANRLGNPRMYILWQMARMSTER